jgi:hypothetical protein
LPTNIALTATNGWLTVNNIRLGTVRGSELVALYKEHGDSLFFENIRDFLGETSGREVPDRSTVNEEIIRTIQEAPTKLLERNNGITFRAASLESDPENKDTLILVQAGIVNGCQTTMCLVSCSSKSDQCFVQVKVVATADAWDVAKAANYQNRVERIELDLAKYLRPQLVKKAATDLGYGVGQATDTTAAGVIDTIYQNRVDYEEMKCLYLGLFSRKPNNLFEANYTELRGDVLEKLYLDPANESEIFSTLFLVLKESRQGLKKCESTFSGEEYASVFRRFFHEAKPRYRAYLAVLALCGSIRLNIADREADAVKEAERTRDFLRRTRTLLENESNIFHRRYLLSFQVLSDCALDAGDEGDVAQSMFQKVSKTAFTTLYLKLLTRIDGDRTLQDS